MVDIQVVSLEIYSSAVIALAGAIADGWLGLHTYQHRNINWHAYALTPNQAGK